jgi:hypothetical protein
MVYWPLKVKTQSISLFFDAFLFDTKNKGVNDGSAKHNNGLHLAYTHGERQSHELK